MMPIWKVVANFCKFLQNFILFYICGHLFIVSQMHEQETVSGSGISWAICNSAPRPRLITMPAPHHSIFTGRMPFLLLNQQHQNTEGKILQIGRQTKITLTMPYRLSLWKGNRNPSVLQKKHGIFTFCATTTKNGQMNVNINKDGELPANAKQEVIPKMPTVNWLV